MADERGALLSVTAHVATILLNRPDTQNALDESTIGDLQSILDQVGKMDDISALVLRGKGRSFSAGTDPGWLKRALGNDAARNQQDAQRLTTMLQTLNTLPQTTIAQVHGAATGIGMGLICCCDIVFADQAATFAMPETRLGLIPASVGPYVIAAIGPRQARRYFQTGERIAAGTALAIGLVHEMVGKAEDLERRCDDLLVTLGENGPLATRAAKRLARELTGRPIDTDLQDFTSAKIAELRASPEGREGVTAMLERRRPPWHKAGG